MIKFPRVHIAESVKNRLLDLRDELSAAGKAPSAEPAAALPNVPDPRGQGALLDAELDAGVPVVAAPDAATEQAALLKPILR